MLLLYSYFYFVNVGWFLSFPYVEILLWFFCFLCVYLQAEDFMCSMLYCSAAALLQRQTKEALLD